MKLIERATGSRFAIYFLKLYSYLSLRLNRKERKNKWPSVECPISVEALGLLMTSCKILWVPDKYIDLVSVPEKLQEAINRQKGTSNKRAFTANLDCDDYSRYCCEALCLLEKKHPRTVSNVKMQSVLYRYPNGKVSGHFICSFKWHDRYCHIGNWGLYTRRKGNDLMFNTKHVAHDIASRKRARLITSWTVNHRTLRGWERVI